jgi:hypothetical protein
MGDMADEFLSLFQQANENPLLFDEEQMLQILYGLQTALSDLGLNQTSDLASAIIGDVLGPNGLPALPDGFAESLDPAIMELIDAVSAAPQPTPVTMDAALLTDLATNIGEKNYDSLRKNNLEQSVKIGREVGAVVTTALMRFESGLANAIGTAVGSAVGNAMNGA